jgi:hypothetical protein
MLLNAKTMKKKHVHPNTGLVNLEELSHQFTEVNTTVRHKVKRQFSSVPLILCIDNFHGQVSLTDLGLTHGHGFGFVLTLGKEHGDFIGFRQTEESLWNNGLVRVV